MSLLVDGVVLLAVGLPVGGVVLLAEGLVLLAPVSELAVPEGAALVVPAAPVVPMGEDPGAELALPVPQ